MSTTRQDDFLESFLDDVKMFDHEGERFWVIDEDAEANARRRLRALTSIEDKEAAVWDLLSFAEVCEPNNPDGASILVELAVETLEAIERSAGLGVEQQDELRQRTTALLGGPARATAPAPAGPAFSALALRAGSQTKPRRRRRR